MRAAISFYQLFRITNYFTLSLRSDESPLRLSVEAATLTRGGSEMLLFDLDLSPAGFARAESLSLHVEPRMWLFNSFKDANLRTKRCFSGYRDGYRD